jgi:Family of unknown function (DUF5906)
MAENRSRKILLPDETIVLADGTPIKVADIVAEDGAKYVGRKCADPHDTLYKDKDCAIILEDRHGARFIWSHHNQDGRFELRPTSDPDVVIIDGIMKKITTLGQLNKDFALLEVRGSPSCYISRKDCLPITDADLKRRLAGDVIRITTAKGDQYIPAEKAWTESASRHAYRRIVFTSKLVADDCFNLFKGLGVEPEEGCCVRQRYHIREVVCADDAKAAVAMEKLLAWQIQNIGKPSRVVLILRSTEQQVRKGLLLGEIMTKIYGSDSGLMTSSMDHVLGKFNSAIRGRAFIFLDEVPFAGDRKTANMVKTLSTATISSIEEKHCRLISALPRTRKFQRTSKRRTSAIGYWKSARSGRRTPPISRRFLMRLRTAGGKPLRIIS